MAILTTSSSWRRTGAGALLTLLGTATLTLGLAQPAQAGSFHGVVTQGPLRAGDYELMNQGDVGTLRLRVSWNRVQPTLAGYSWAWLDAIVNSAAVNGVRVIPEIDGPAPPGASTPPTDAASRRAYAEMTGAMADRYGRGGYFWNTPTRPYSVPITVWQIYNEQNGRAYWQAKPSPRAYGKLVKAAAKQIRAQDRRAEIVLGGMFGTPSGAGSVTSWSYLKRLYRIRGIKAAFDTVAIHPYSSSLRGIKFQIRKVRRVMAQKRDRRASMRITEFGWGSARRGGDLNLGRRGQARMLKKAFILFERKRRAWRLKGANWFSWQDDPAAACYFCPSSGLFTENRRAKPSWRAFKRVARR